MSLRSRLLLLCAVALIPAVLVVAFLEVELRRARETEVNDAVVRQTQQATSEVARVVEGTRALLGAVASAPSIQALDEPACTDFLQRITRDRQIIRSIGVLAPDGRLRCSGRPEEDRPSYADRPYVAEALRTGAFTVGTYTRSRVAPGVAVLPFALPIRRDDGTLVGLAVANLDLARFNAIVADWALGAGGALTIADRDGVILARKPLPERFVGTQIPEPFRSWVGESEPGVEEVRSQDGTVRILSYKPAALAPVGLYVSSGVATAEAFALVEAASRRSLLIMIAGALATLLAAALAGEHFVRRPVAHLLARAEAWRVGQVPQPDGAPEGPEFGRIAAAIDATGGALRGRERAAREGEERLQRAVRSAPFPMLLHASDGEIVELSASWLRDSGWTGRIPDLQSWTTIALRTAEGEGSLPATSGERAVVTPDGALRHWDLHAVPLGALPDGRALTLLAAVDLTERRRAESRQTLLVAELNHRVKNTLAMVQAIAGQTLRSTASPAAFNERFAQRISALARAHGLLTRSDWRGVSLLALLMAELDHVPSLQVALSGPEIELPGEFAVSLSLIFHELTTNAIKYGALSVPEGRLSVEWRRCAADPATLDLTWAERGGPPVTAEPARRGFGSRLIARTTDGLGEGGLAYGADGVTFRLRAALRPETAGPGRDEPDFGPMPPSGEATGGLRTVPFGPH